MVSNAVAALVLSAVVLVPPDWVQLVLTLVASLLMYAGGSTLNDVFDARFDAAHRPERAIPRGVFSRAAAAWVGAVEMGMGAAIFLRVGASPILVASLIAVILAYDWVHKRWAGSVLLMAGCRLLLALVIGSLPGHAWAGVFLAWAVAVYAYIIVLSVLARMEWKEKAGAGKGDGRKAMGDRKTRIHPKTIGRMLAFIPLLDAIALAATANWIPALVCLAAIPAGKWAQRRLAST